MTHRASAVGRRSLMPVSNTQKAPGSARASLLKPDDSANGDKKSETKTGNTRGSLLAPRSAERKPTNSRPKDPPKEARSEGDLLKSQKSLPQEPANVNVSPPAADLTDADQALQELQSLHPVSSQQSSPSPGSLSSKLLSSPDTLAAPLCAIGDTSHSLGVGGGLLGDVSETLMEETSETRSRYKSDGSSGTEHCPSQPGEPCNDLL